ncbi:MAG: hypothetical protein HKM28_02560, partial [Flavobacteriaceae bacterium]|nr:hypothetical protein [Flavobacteriaceae bacterium]
MKIISQISMFLFLSIFFVFTSCQQEEQEYIDENNEETLTANSNLVLLMTQTSQNDGSFDDILDDNSCASIVLPVTVIANGQEVVINDEDDYDIVEDIFDESSTDTDTLEIQFPIE